jgi:hypothetical protein
LLVVVPAQQFKALLWFHFENGSGAKSIQLQLSDHPQLLYLLLWVLTPPAPITLGAGEFVTPFPHPQGVDSNPYFMT